MLKIAHRGLLHGPDSTKENTVAQIKIALSLGFNVELDVRLIDGKLYLGHDKPQERIDVSFLENPRIWTHCKTISAFNLLIDNEYVNCFTHNDEDYVITSKGYVWGHSRHGKFIYDTFLPKRKIIAEYANDWLLRVISNIEKEDFSI